MKKLILATLAASILATPVVAQPMQRHMPPPRAMAPQHHNWRKGDRFDQRQAPNYQVVDYHRYHGLRAPPRGYRYVRSGNDVVLVAITTGIIASVFANMIR
jgi:Ni/Co efflux regulator RcnB